MTNDEAYEAILGRLKAEVIRLHARNVRAVELLRQVDDPTKNWTGPEGAMAMVLQQKTHVELMQFLDGTSTDDLFAMLKHHG